MGNGIQGAQCWESRDLVLHPGPAAGSLCDLGHILRLSRAWISPSVDQGVGLRVSTALFSSDDL